MRPPRTTSPSYQRSQRNFTRGTTRTAPAYTGSGRTGTGRRALTDAQEDFGVTGDFRGRVKPPRQAWRKTRPFPI
jgi:hypothetical protein